MMKRQSSAGEESINALLKLRQENNKGSQRKAMLGEIESQLQSIQSLKQEKELLTAQLHELLNGEDPFVLYDDPLVEEDRKQLRELKEKLAAHRVIGPCGLTVLEVNQEMLVVTFTCMWLNTTEVFVLSITEADGGLKVKATNVPYFTNIINLVEQSKESSWNKLMDNIGQRLNSYVRRKGEMQAAKEKCEDIISSCNTNDAHTSIELHLKVQRETEPATDLTCWLDYDSVDAIQPSEVEIIQDSSQLTDKELQEMRESLLQLPISEALPSIQERLKTGRDGETQMEAATSATAE